MPDAKHHYTEMLPAPCVAPVRINGVPIPALTSAAWQAESGVTVLEYLNQARRIVAPPRYRQPIKGTWLPAASIVDQDICDALAAADAMPICEVVLGIPVSEWFAETGSYSVAPRVSAWSIEDLREPSLGMVQAQFERVVLGSASISGSTVTVTSAPCAIAYLPVCIGKITVAYAYNEGMYMAASIDFQEATFA